MRDEFSKLIDHSEVDFGASVNQILGLFNLLNFALCSTEAGKAQFGGLVCGSDDFGIAVYSHD
jgi:hypothetical protein